MNENETINTCLNALISSTSAFDPANSGSATSANVNAALSTICSSSFDSKCKAPQIRTSLTDFYTACQTDLLGTNGDGSNGHKDIIAIYDVLYLILPLKEAICATDNGRYCVVGNSPTSGSSVASSAAASSSGSGPASSDAPSAAASNSGSESASSSASPSASASASSSASSASASAPAKRDVLHQPTELSRRQATNTNGTNQETLSSFGPDADEYRSSGLPYLFITPNKTDICGDVCTAKVIGAYIRFETVTPYAIGIANSPILKGQLELWNRLTQCPDGFAQNLLDNSTGIPANSPNGAAKAAAGVGSALVAVFAAVGAAVLL